MKKILSLALIAVLCAALALATGCTPKDTTGDKDTVSLTVENIYGSSDLTEDQIAAFQNSGEITLYTDKADVAKGEYDDDTKAALEFYKKYYGLTIKYKYQAYGDNLTKFMVDFANGDAPDMIGLNYRRWPKAGNRQIIYSLSELEEKGVLGLDHPEMEKYKDLREPYVIDGEYYSPIATYCSPVICAVNLDLFDEYKVKSPVEYYKEGTWDMDAYIKCCKEITRTKQDGTKIWGTFGWNYSWYLIANDARLVQWDDNYKLKLTMNDPLTVETLTTWKSLYDNEYSLSAEQWSQDQPFKSGNMGMYIYTANNLANEYFNNTVTFKWDVVPMPYGSKNTSGLVPGEVSGSGVVTSTKNAQGVINYLIATRIWENADRNDEYSLYNIHTYEGVYNEEQMELIYSFCDKIDQDLYMGVGNLSNGWLFWNDIKGGTMTIKECIEKWEPVWQEQVDEENAESVRK